MEKYKYPLSADGIRRRFANKALQNIDIIIYDVTDSTNTRAKLYAKNEGKAKRAPAVFIARGQSAGRGTRGRTFESLPGKGLYISFLFYPDSLGTEVLRVSTYAATRLIRALDPYVQDARRLGIKWVNDVYLDEKKLAGILTEGELGEGGTLSFAISGIGINLYRAEWDDGLAAIATSLEEAGIEADPEALAASLIEEFFSSLNRFAAAEVYEEYASRSILTEEPVTVISANGTFDAVAEKIYPDFSLSVRLRDGTERRLISADVSVRKKVLGG